MSSQRPMPAESAERYRAFVRNSAEGIWRFEIEQPIAVTLPPREQIGRFYRYCFLAECNDAFAQMYGVERAAEFVGTRLGDLLDPARPESSALLEAFIASGYRLSGAEAQEDKDGFPRHYQISLFGVVEEGCLVRAWGTQRDVTERREMEAALARQAEERTLLYEAASLLGRTLDADVIYDTMHALIARVMDCNSLIVSAYTPEDNLIRCAYAWIEGERNDPAQFPAIPLAPTGRGLQSKVIRSGEPLLIQDVPEETTRLKAVHYVSRDGTVDDRPSTDPMETRSLLLVPIKLEERVLGVAQVMSHRTAAYTDAHLRFLEAVMAQVAAATRNAFLYQQARAEIAERKRVEEENLRLQRLNEAAARQQRTFLREILAGVSEGRLLLCDAAGDLPSPLPVAADPLELTTATLKTLRGQVEQVACGLEFEDTRWRDLATAASEAAMNAVVHAGGGQARVHAGPAGILQVWIEDTGKGIAEATLHRATLEPGYTTAGTLGHGFWLILKMSDRVYLLTGPGGTTVVLEQERTAPEPFWLRRYG